MEFHKLPVFIHPSEFCFSVTEKTSQKQILTVYNPYDFSIKFKSKLVIDRGKRSFPGLF